jgi:hypothetical protein
MAYGLVNLRALTKLMIVLLPLCLSEGDQVEMRLRPLMLLMSLTCHAVPFISSKIPSHRACTGVDSTYRLVD